MSSDLLRALDKARNLICTPLVLEVLDDLAHGRSPYERREECKAITAALRCLASLGAARFSSPDVIARVPSVELTPNGRVLYDRLVEIEEWAARQETATQIAFGHSA